jgi:hypothetical protein
MQQWIDIGPCPADEECEQANVSGANYERMKQECRALIGQLRRQLGPEPEGAQLITKFNRDGDHGYYEAVCYYEPKNRAAIDYAFRCEMEMPAKWDDIARKELNIVDAFV